jgi:catechol 2,3-dioxygenase
VQHTLSEAWATRPSRHVAPVPEPSATERRENPRGDCCSRLTRALRSASSGRRHKRPVSGRNPGPRGIWKPSHLSGAPVTRAGHYFLHMSLIETTALPATLRLGAVHLTVKDVDRAVAWYQQALGLRVHGHDATTAELGDGVETVVVLHEDPQARPPGRHTGLYHYALLYPSREELARAALRLIATRTPIQGASDHRTHEAIYLADADGNGIELAADRAHDQWPADLGYAGGPAPLDTDSLLATLQGEPPADHVGEGLRMGHVHLHVGDIEQGLGFYRDVLGFEEQANLGSAAFVSAGGYHHHLGMNIWSGRAPAPDHTVGLRLWTVQLPTDADLADVRGRVETAGHAIEPVDGGFLVRDPWRTALAFVSTTVTGLSSHAVVATAKPSPYLLQLAKHFRHKRDVRFDEHSAVIPFAFGTAELAAEPQALTIAAHAHTPADLERVKHVVGSHLERFGRRDELEVSWS